MEALKRTPIYEYHKNVGAKLVDYAGFEMPVTYQGLIQEHQAVRENCGLFDVSHMGEFLIEGPGVAEFLDYALTNFVSKTSINQAQYNIMLYENGTAVDDLIVYRLAEDRFLLVVNAANIKKDFDHLSQLIKDYSTQLQFKNLSDEYALLALQGPRSPELLKTLDIDLDLIKPFYFKNFKIAGQDCLLARTGYTGETGAEIFVNTAQASTEALAVWNTLIEAGKSFGLQAIGLAARDTLRLEKAYPLYGHELSDKINPYQANLAWVVKLEKDNFVAKAALEEYKSQQSNSMSGDKIFGFKMTEAGIAREGHQVFSDNGRNIGIVTSGTRSPTLKESIFLALCQDVNIEPGDMVTVSIRDKKKKAVCVTIPFV